MARAGCRRSQRMAACAPPGAHGARRSGGRGAGARGTAVCRRRGGRGASSSAATSSWARFHSSSEARAFLVAPEPAHQVIAAAQRPCTHRTASARVGAVDGDVSGRSQVHERCPTPERGRVGHVQSFTSAVPRDRRRTRIYAARRDPRTTVRTVADVMSSPVVTALPDETVAAAAARMHDRSRRVGRRRRRRPARSASSPSATSCAWPPPGPSAGGPRSPSG